jgi:hypothetical protein
VKTFAILTIICAMAFPTLAAPTNPLESFSPHFSTNTQIICQFQMKNLPKSFWIYKKLPRIFSATAISNAIILASFQSKGFPKPSTNPVVIWDNHFEGEPEPRNFSINPAMGEISYFIGDQAPDTWPVSTNQEAVQHAWNFLPRLGINQSELIKTNTGAEGVWGVFLPRQIDGIESFNGLQGFSFQQYTGENKMRCFSLVMPNLERYQNSPTASAQQIINCMRASKTPVIANDDELDYPGRIKSLARAKKFIITKITPYYTEGIYGETNFVRTDLVTPIAELEAVADFGNSNMTVHLYSPITSSDINRLLKK